MARDFAALHARYLAGESGTAIAASIGIGFTSLYRSWHRRGYPLRSMSEAKKLGIQQRPELGRLIEHATAKRRGAVDPIERKERRAATRQARMLGTSYLEDQVAGWLDEMGIGYIRQQAIGPYNVDFAMAGRGGRGLVLEVEGGGHSTGVRANRHARRAYIEAAGWDMRMLPRRQITRRGLHEVMRPG